MRAPGFWQHDGGLARLLSPLSGMTAMATRRRLARPGVRVGVPVVCCGNATVGGAGKTLLALDLARRALAAGQAVHVLTRGHGGRRSGLTRVEPWHDAAAVGDEALLLAAVAPCWVSADRAAAARAAVAAGATLLVMDDGLQNPGLCKDLSLLVVDAVSGFGNGRLLPAGPLREPVAAAASRCQAAVVIGEGVIGAGVIDAGVIGDAVVALPGGLPRLQATLQPDEAMRGLAGRRVLAFAGIGRPEKFFASLEQVGAVVTRAAFGDHHRYSRQELRRLLGRAAQGGLTLATTPKDAVRLPEEVRRQVTVAGVGLAWADEAALTALLQKTVGL